LQANAPTSLEEALYFEHDGFSLVLTFFFLHACTHARPLALAALLFWGTIPMISEQAVSSEMRCGR